MSRILKNILAVFTALTVMAAAFAAIPAVKASAVSAVKYSVSYSTKYVKLKLTAKASTNKIYYTTNGAAPSIRSKLYKKTLAASAKVTVRAAEFDRYNRQVASLKITIAPRVQAPKFTASTSSSGQRYLKMTSATSGAKIYYTTDGSTPTKSSARYTAEIKYTPGITVTARAYKSNMKVSLSSEYFEEPEEEEEDDEEPEEYEEDDEEEDDDDGVDEDDGEEDEEQPEPDPNSGSADNDAVIKRVGELINKERVSAGVGTLTLDSKLCELAQIRAKELVSSYSHTRPDGNKYHTVLTGNGVNYLTSGENIAYGMNTLFTADEVMKSWMDSSGHRANILNVYFGKVGVARYISGSNVYWVQIFTD